MVRKRNTGSQLDWLISARRAIAAIGLAVVLLGLQACNSDGPDSETNIPDDGNEAAEIHCAPDAAAGCVDSTTGART